MTSHEFERLRTLVMGAIALADSAQTQLHETAQAMRAAYARVAELEAERDNLRKQLDQVASRG